MSRSTAREVTMKQLYARECKGESDYRFALQAREDKDDQTIQPSQNDELFAAMLFHGVLENMEKTDEQIVAQSKGWKIERIAMIERIILRMAIFEMLFCEDIPVSVSINEAVELAKRYGSNDRAGAYVNGVLGAVSRSQAAQ